MGMCGGRRGSEREKDYEIKKKERVEERCALLPKRVMRRGAAERGELLSGSLTC